MYHLDKFATSLPQARTNVRPSPPIDGLKGPWSMSRHCPEPRRFFGDPTLLARNNILNAAVVLMTVWGAASLDLQG